MTFHDKFIWIVCSLTLGLFSSLALADAPHILSLSENAASYSVGTQAVLTAYVQILPEDSNYEFHLSAQFAGQEIKVSRISDSQAFSITPMFTQTGSYNWVVKVFLQEKRAAREMDTTIQFYGNEINQLQTQLASETDPSVISQLQAQIARDQALVATAQTELTAGRRCVEQDTLSVAVTGAAPPYAIDVNAGGPAYNGADGTPWSVDTGFTGGALYSTNANIAGTADPTLYQTVRYGTAFGYTFTVPNGTYSVTLKFAEIYWTSVGSRVFDVGINGTQVLQNFDVFSQAHGANIALDETFSVTVTSGQIAINLTGVTDNADISAIRIVQTGAK